MSANASVSCLQSLRPRNWRYNQVLDVQEMRRRKARLQAWGGREKAPDRARRAAFLLSQT
jgi:hypothetical protein